MFRRKQRMAIEVASLSSLVAHNMTIKGDVMFEGGFRVDGRIEGNVIGQDDTHGLLVLSDKGTIAGRVKVYDAVINGTIEGDLEVEHCLELQANARISGNITYRQLQMECGSTVHGKLERLHDPAGAEASAETRMVALIGPPRTAGNGS